MFNAFLAPKEEPVEEEDGGSSGQGGTGTRGEPTSSFSWFDMAKELATNVQKSTSEIVQSATETDWGKEFRDFGSAIQQDTHEMVEETKTAVNAGDGVNIKLPKSKQEVQESIEVLGSTIESFGKSILGGTTEILSQMKETVQQEMQAASIKHRQTQQEMAKAKRSAGDGAGSKEDRRKKRYEDKVSAMQRDSSTYCDEPEDLEYYEVWESHFVLAEHEAQVEETLSGNAFLLELQSRIVPLIVDRETFWTQYFFRLHLIELEEGMTERFVEKRGEEPVAAQPDPAVEEQVEEQVEEKAEEQASLEAETPEDEVDKVEEAEVDGTSSPSGFSPVQGECPQGSAPRSASHSRNPSGPFSEPDAATASDSSATDWINVKTKNRDSPPPQVSPAAQETPTPEEEGEAAQAEADGAEPQEDVEDEEEDVEEEELSPLPSPAPGSAVDDDDIDEDWGEI